MTNDSSAQKSYAIVTKSVFTSVETQTDITWLNNADKPTRLMVKNTEKIVNSSKKVTNSSQTTSSSRTTTTSDSKSSTSSNSSSHQNKKEQKKNKNLKLKTETCRNDRARQKRTLSRSITDMDVLMMRRRSPYGMFLRMIHHLHWMSRHQKRGDLRVDLQKGGRRKGSQRKKSFSPIRHP